MVAVDLNSVSHCDGVTGMPGDTRGAVLTPALSGGVQGVVSGGGGGGGCRQ